MKNVVGFSSELIFLSVFSFTTTVIGLECYSCLDVDRLSASIVKELSYAGMSGDKSCQMGKIPESKLKQPCTPLLDDNGEEIPPVCAQLHVEGTFGENESMKLTARGCFHANITIEDLTKEDGCDDQSLQELLNIALGVMKDGLKEGGKYIPLDTTGTFCHCNSDNCNSAIGLLNGRKKISALVPLIALLHVSRMLD